MAMPSSEIIVRKETETRDKTRIPPKFNVVALNDDFTPMVFVVNMLTDVFNKTREEATVVMFQIHKEGKGVCGTYTRDIAETKIQRATDSARSEGHPLHLEIQPA